MACKEISKMLEDIECEGLNYALIHYDKYDIPNENFMKAYNAYLKADHEMKKVLKEEFGFTRF